ncbi:MAG TPA: adenylosuccinate lyase [Thermoprotei archaeon]|nr:adenylosuccinate lyase [Thermoprotei archaeon]
MIHPIEYRYGSNDMRKIFDRDSWVKYAVDVEFALLESLVEIGLFNIDKEMLREAHNRAREINYALVKKYEERYKHELFALIHAIYEVVDREVGKALHVGMTSNDVIDNVLMLQIRDALRIILKRLDEVINLVKNFVERYKKQLVVGRTHGRYAVPITLGFRFLLYLDELLRSRGEIKNSLERFIVGKLGGAVGSQVELYPEGAKIESLMLQKLGLKPASTYLQIIPRDLIAYTLLRIIVLSSVLEHIANEIRVLSKSGIDEVSEGFNMEQVGSSVMPHKRNPVLSEKVCGLARYIRGLAPSILENIVFEDERDLRNSSLERTLIPELFLLVDEQLITIRDILESLIVNVKKCEVNLESAGYEIYSSLLLHIGVRNGGDRQKIHERLKKIFLKQYKSIEELYEAIKSDDFLVNYFNIDDLRMATDLNIYISACESKINQYLNNLNLE